MKKTLNTLGLWLLIALLGSGMVVGTVTGLGCAGRVLTCAWRVGWNFMDRFILP